MTRSDLPRLLGAAVRRTPVIIQAEAAECGLACMAMMAGHYGHVLDLPAMRRRSSASYLAFVTGSSWCCTTTPGGSQGLTYTLSSAALRTAASWIRRAIAAGLPDIVTCSRAAGSGCESGSALATSCRS